MPSTQCISCPYRTGPIQASLVRQMHVVVPCCGALHYVPIYGTNYCEYVPGGGTEQLNCDDMINEHMREDVSRWKKLRIPQR